VAVKLMQLSGHVSFDSIIVDSPMGRKAPVPRMALNAPSFEL
jgi:tRNA G10  N-methylase Trm11|tara:strand:- start:1826 stop:1951 length:126 start_codon:yes stop_codon:yes gene_type:complete